MRRIAVPLSALVILAAILPASPVRAATPSITTYFNTCPAYGGVRICSGLVPMRLRSSEKAISRAASSAR